MSMDKSFDAQAAEGRISAQWEKAGAFVHQQIIWVKDRGVLTRSHYLWKHEPCFMGWRRPNRPPKPSRPAPARVRAQRFRSH